MEVIFISVIPTLVTLILGLLLHKRKMAKLHSEQYNKVEALVEKVDELTLFHKDRIKIRLSAASAIQVMVSKIFTETHADRFLVGIAYNGKTDVQYISIIYEQHQDGIKMNLSIGATEAYDRLPIDDPYRDMLRQAESKGYVYEKTNSMKPSVLKDIYEEEGVTETKISFINRQELRDGRTMIIFSSTGTHAEKGFNIKDQRKLRVRLPALKEIIAKEFKAYE